MALLEVECIDLVYCSNEVPGLQFTCARSIAPEDVMFIKLLLSVNGDFRRSANWR